MIGNLHKPPAIVVGATLVLAAGLILSLYAWVLRREASMLLTDVVALKVGTSSGKDADLVAQKHHHYFVGKECQNASCQYSFVITNTGLSLLHLAPPAKFWTGITVDNDTVTHVSAMLARSMPIFPTFQASAGMVDEYAELRGNFSSGEHYRFPTPVGKPYLRVTLDRHATSQQRQHAFAFSFRCLTKLGGGCDLSCDYLPSAWQDWKANLRMEEWPMNNFDKVYPNNQRCK